MIDAVNAKKEAANNARQFLVEFIDQAILLQATEHNKDASVTIDLSEEGARDVAHIMNGFPTTYAHVCDEYHNRGWDIETQCVPKFAKETTTFVLALVLRQRSEKVTFPEP